jgi:hypothetical protein
MAEKEWRQMSGWEKAWEVTKVVGGIGLAVLAIIAMASGGGAPVRSSGGSRSVWTVGHGGKKGYGSWSSFRHG